MRFELIFLDETARDMVRLPTFDRIKLSHMKGQYAVYFLFHVPPDIQPRELHTGRRPVDLSDIELVTPK